MSFAILSLVVGLSSHPPINVKIPPNIPFILSIHVNQRKETVMQTPTYRAASRELLAQANAELDAGDSRQASEKAWGAAAQMVKAIAQDRGWQHASHPLIFQTGDRLAEETGDEQIIALAPHRR